MSQQKGKLPSNGIPDINSAHYGSVSTSKRSPTPPKQAPLTQNNKPASSRIRKAPTSATQVGVQASVRKSTEASGHHTGVKKTKKAPAPSVKKSTVKTKEELIAKRREEERIRLQKERRKKLAQQNCKKNLEKISTFFKLLFKGTGVYLANIAVGIILAFVVGLLISIIYYRSVTVYNSDVTKTYYAFYSYIDPEDETEAAEKRREARENNEESAKVSFKKKHIVLNDVAYLPISSLTQFFGMSMSGDDTVRTISLNNTLDKYGKPDSAVFTSGSKTIELNGAIHTLSNAPIFKNHDVYVPFEFFEKYVVGISFKSTKKRGKTTIGVILEEPHISFVGSENRIIETPNIKNYI